MIDAHLHLQDTRLAEDRKSIIATLRQLGVAHWCVNGIHPGDWRQVADLAREHDEVIPFFGVHPWEVNGLEGGWRTSLREFLEANPEAGIGEVGLDKWIRNHDISRQRDILGSQLALAEELKRPVAVHCLQAWGHLDEVLEGSKFRRPFLLHSYGGPSEFVERMCERGAYFSISGYFFREDKGEKRQVFLQIPEDRILIETDAPDMEPPESCVEFHVSTSDKEEAPFPNHPGNIRAIYRAYAEFRDRGIDEIIESTRHNFQAWMEKSRR